MNENSADAALATEIRHNFRCQHRNNQARIRELHRYATAGFARVFDRVPVLLHCNDPSEPGYVDDPATPRGVKLVERQLWLPRDRRRPAGDWCASQRRPVVESLFLIGSSGSIGHNAASDLDYWVCHENGAMTPREFELFQRKLQALTDWARTEEGTEAHFYTVDLDDPVRGRLIRLDTVETEGEVAPLLLLEELYRTFLFVAGRPPIWQGLPLTVDEDRYRELSRVWASGPDAEYVDLGFPAPPPPQQMLAAALWLARKSEADPFKGCLKIVALLDQVESDFTRPLLCNQLKEAVHNAAPEGLPVDPYLLAIDRVTEYGNLRLTPEQLKLLRFSVVLKVLGVGRPAPSASLDIRKKTLLEAWAHSWGWPPDRLKHLAAYHVWPAGERLGLSRDILDMLSGLYIRTAQYLLKHYPGQIDPQDDELAPLAARLLTRRKGLDATVETLPAPPLPSTSLSRLLVLRRKPGGGPGWNLHALDGQGRLDSGNLIYHAQRMTRVAAWIVHNQISGARAVLENEAGDDAYRVSSLDLERLLKILREVFPPFSLHREDADTMWLAGGHGRIVVALNVEEPADQAELVTADLILRTGWGEMRHYCVRVDELSQEADKYLKIARVVWKESAEAQPENLVFHSSDTPAMRAAANNLRGALAALRRGRGEDGKRRRLDV